jgi:catechol 2,3-dioxygenase-like lactoylglutathione lyase family enzyme
MTPRQPLIAQLGTVMQLAFVPQNFDVALRYWTQTLGVGPFFSMEHISLPNCRYEGQPSDIDFSIAIAYWGDMQIELIRQHNDAPSIYKRWRDEGREGLHHVCIVVDDMAKARRTCAAAGARVAQEADDAGGGPGGLIELIQLPRATLDAFGAMREVCSHWDGRDPLRKLG